MWPKAEEDEGREERRTLTELYAIDWRETSFVPMGDNPPARIVMWKTEPGDLSDEEIEQIIEEAENDGGGIMDVSKFTKRADLWREITKRATLKASAEAAEASVPLTDELIAAVRGRIVAASDELQQALSELPGELEVPEPEIPEDEPVMGKAAEPYAELERVARQMYPNEDVSVAITKAASARPDLRDRVYAAQRS